jgi:hypothetical protein
MHANSEAAVPALAAAVESVRLPNKETTAPARGMDAACAPPESGQRSTVRPRSTTPRSTLAIDRSDSLIREASFLAEARAALLRGDAKSALRKVRAARSLPVRQLVPEQLSVEAQTLRALDRASEAVEVERTLRTKYPESALAR